MGRRFRRTLVAVVVAVLAIGGLVWAGQQLVARLSTASPAHVAFPAAPTCPSAAPVVVDGITVPAGPIAGLCQDRLANAAHVIAAARYYGIGTHTQTIGVMTALGESGLVNLDHGDAAGADSRGIFQQRDNGAWGTLADRMNPYIAARHFFKALVSIPDWKSLTPTQAAHAVQGNADPNYYTAYWPRAQTIVAALAPNG